MPSLYNHDRRLKAMQFLFVGNITMWPIYDLYLAIPTRNHNHHLIMPVLYMLGPFPTQDFP
ncbi:hypothetical protein SODALDRAFT_197055 [Sodiomyces alkalinus F11]|uniref:Uncharacterized protein n=1 Tax=Sodiomyces alkalinus (strain CBS 110278 / VKM F-3762 / F11) TaxID=1314773 RepID=A0A3N2PSG5_SODAK|nr:hypothetical protein SODALDRAFT_197055 [Sodiomyces alkalinus F11]ROT37447.1 hypothetical protein SODALDRAFT_197055 [Sodiomyces alkalinus F11]